MHLAFGIWHLAFDWAEYRKASTLLNLYTEPLIVSANGTTRIYSQWSGETSTGRLASNNPNLQNLPHEDKAISVADGDGNGNDVYVNIRSAFHCPDGVVFLSADYCQIELRVWHTDRLAQTQAHITKHNYCIWLTYCVATTDSGTLGSRYGIDPAVQRVGRCVQSHCCQMAQKTSLNNHARGTQTSQDVDVRHTVRRQWQPVCRRVWCIVAEGAEHVRESAQGLSNAVAIHRTNTRV
jgi:hypothetical protein